MGVINNRNNNRLFCLFKLKFWISGQFSGWKSYVLVLDYFKMFFMDLIIKIEFLIFRVNRRGFFCYILI